MLAARHKMAGALHFFTGRDLMNIKDKSPAGPALAGAAVTDSLARPSSSVMPTTKLAAVAPRSQLRTSWPRSA